MSQKQISIKFCGGCNPKIDRGRIAEEVQSMLSPTEFSVCYNRLDVDFVVYLSGCQSNCAQRYNPTEEAGVAIVAGATVDSLGIEEKELAAEIAKRVRDFFE